MRKQFKNKAFPLPQKHFIFGYLRVKSPNAAPRNQGYVTWSWHVAPQVRLNDGKIYILDPILHADPVPRNTWYKTTTSQPGVPATGITGVASCNSATWWPSDHCFNASNKSAEKWLDSEVQNFLNR